MGWDRQGMVGASEGWIGQLGGAAAWLSLCPGPIAGGCLSPGGLKLLPVAGSISRGRSGRSAWAWGFPLQEGSAGQGV